MVATVSLSPRVPSMISPRCVATRAPGGTTASMLPTVSRQHRDKLRPAERYAPDSKTVRSRPNTGLSRTARGPDSQYGDPLDRVWSGSRNGDAEKLVAMIASEDVNIYTSH